MARGTRLDAHLGILWRGSSMIICGLALVYLAVFASNHNDGTKKRRYLIELVVVALLALNAYAAFRFFFFFFFPLDVSQ